MAIIKQLTNKHFGGNSGEVYPITTEEAVKCGTRNLNEYMQNLKEGYTFAGFISPSTTNSEIQSAKRGTFYIGYELGTYPIDNYTLFLPGILIYYKKWNGTWERQRILFTTLSNLEEDFDNNSAARHSSVKTAVNNINNSINSINDNIEEIQNNTVFSDDIRLLDPYVKMALAGYLQNNPFTPPYPNSNGTWPEGYVNPSKIFNTFDNKFYYIPYSAINKDSGVIEYSQYHHTSDFIPFKNGMHIKTIGDVGFAIHYYGDSQSNYYSNNITTNFAPVSDMTLNLSEQQAADIKFIKLEFGAKNNWNSGMLASDGEDIKKTTIENGIVNLTVKPNRQINNLFFSVAQLFYAKTTGLTTAFDFEDLLVQKGFYGIVMTTANMLMINGSSYMYRQSCLKAVKKYNRIAFILLKDDDSYTELNGLYNDVLQFGLLESVVFMGTEEQLSILLNIDNNIIICPYSDTCYPTSSNIRSIALRLKRQPLTVTLLYNGDGLGDWSNSQTFNEAVLKSHKQGLKTIVFGCDTQAIFNQCVYSGVDYIVINNTTTFN